MPNWWQKTTELGQVGHLGAKIGLSHIISNWPQMDQNLASTQNHA